jgi:hypothetical protein
MIDAFRIWSRQLADDINHRLNRFFRRWLRKGVELVLSDMELALSFQDPGASARFALQHFAGLPNFKNRAELYRWVFAQPLREDGLFLEFGVYKGTTINRTAQLNPRVTFHGFDSFTGLPEPWILEGNTGMFNLGGKLPPVRKNVRLIKGYFKDTLPGFVAQHPGRSISYLHIDCDLYSSTKTIFDTTKHMIGPGTVIVFDEYLNYPGWQEGEHKAFMEFIAETKLQFAYVAYIRTAMQVVVRIL